MGDSNLCDDPLHQLELRLVAAVTDTRANDTNNSATGLCRTLTVHPHLDG